MTMSSVAANAKKQVLILGIDTFAAKNKSQIEALAPYGYAFTVATPDARKDSLTHFRQLETQGHKLLTLSANPIVRLQQLKSLFDAGPYNHVELYAGGRFTVFYLLMLRLYRCNWVVVERGDIGSVDMYPRSAQRRLTRTYRLAPAIWYKEPYMRPLLDAAGAKRLFFVPNAAASVSSGISAQRDIDFLWANRLVHIRHPDWIVRALTHPGLQQSTSAMLGLQSHDRCNAITLALQQYVQSEKPANMMLQGFVDPSPWYARSRYFLLPARLVFGNNALLEAMANGVVPIVTRSPGIDDLIKDGVNGFIANYDEASFMQAMVRAQQLSDEERGRMSDAAIRTIREDFNLDIWSMRMRRMYEDVSATGLQPVQAPAT